VKARDIHSRAQDTLEGGRAERLANRVFLMGTLKGNGKALPELIIWHPALVTRGTGSTFMGPRGEEMAVNTETSYGTQQRL